jgi:opacity protein-like surface antigen
MKGRKSNIKVYLFCFLVLSLFLCSSAALAAAIHVPGDYRTIQAAIDAASDGDTVVVADGTYAGSGNKDIDFKGKELTVQSENGPEHCIIDCGGEGRGFYFHSGELEDAVVAGFTITNGRTSDYGGGIYIANSSPTITHCIIENNRVIGNSNNSHGGGIYLGNGACPTIANCVIVRNTSDYQGGGIYCYNANPIITNCTITRNTAANGGGLYCRYKPAPTLTNCILWGNTPNEVAKDLRSDKPKIRYSVVQGGPRGAGNMNADPLFVGAGNYYHLTKESPCINAGTSTGAPETDIDGDSRPQGRRIDIGADEYTKEQEQKPEG